jgi:hypothetical protein
MESAGKGLEPLRRPVSPQEANLIRWLVEHGDPAALHLLGQVNDLEVVSRCNCGCPTVYFALKGSPTSRKGERNVSDWLARMDDELFGVMLFEVDGQISSLEVYSCSGNVKEFELPEGGMLLGYDEHSADRLAPPPSEPSK